MERKGQRRGGEVEGRGRGGQGRGEGEGWLQILTSNFKRD